VLPFSIVLQTGTPIHEQVVYAVRRAVVTGQLRAGDSFPSVRALSMALKINPNTAHRIVSTLTDEGLLLVRRGVGTVFDETCLRGGAARRATLEDETERLVVQARRAGISLRDLLAAIKRHWSGTLDPEKQ
jgi:GntR family transcriptional regulator